MAEQKQEVFYSTGTTNILDAILTEREYALRRWGKRGLSNGQFTETEQSVGDYICHMQEYLDAARTRLVRESGHDGALEELRKVTALGFRTFQVHGIECRDLSQPIVNGHDQLPA